MFVSNIYSGGMVKKKSMPEIRATFVVLLWCYFLYLILLFYLFTNPGLTDSDSLKVTLNCSRLSSSMKGNMQ